MSHVSTVGSVIPSYGLNGGHLANGADGCKAWCGCVSASQSNNLFTVIKFKESSEFTTHHNEYPNEKG